MKKIIDRLARWIFTVGGFTTSIVILLIIVFLFGEAAGLFRKNIVEDGYSVVVNPSNPVSQLSAQQLKQIFDEDITNWEELGGPDEKIVILRLSDLEKIYSSEELGAQYEHAAACIGRQVTAVPGIVAFLPSSLLDGAEGISIMHEGTIRREGHILRERMVSYRHAGPGVRHPAACRRHAVGEPFRHSDSPSFRAGGIHIYG